MNLRACSGILIAFLGTVEAVHGEEIQRRQVGQVILEGIPEPDPALRAGMLQYLEVRRASLEDIRDDGGELLISTRFGNAAQLHAVSMPLGMRRQLTFFDEPVGGGFYVPGVDGARICLAKDSGGDEKDQWLLLDRSAGTLQTLTDGKSRHAGASISNNGRWLAFSGTARNEKDFDIYLRDLSSNQPAKLVWRVEGSYYVGPFSPDDSRLLVHHFISQRETEWYLLDVESGQTVRVTPDGEPAFYGGGEWSHDGKSLYFTSDRDGDIRRLYHVNLEYGDWHNLTPDVKWDVEGVAVDPTGKGIAFTTNEDGISRLHFASGGGGNRKTVDVPDGVIGGMRFARQGGKLALSINSPTSPSDVYVIDFPEGRADRWTESEIGGLNRSHFVEPELIRYPTFDTDESGQPRTIPAFYYRGKGAGKRPVVIMAHGGPESQTRPVFSSTAQYWAAQLGISVIAPNIRGSTGYGRAFHQLDNGVKRADSIKDIGALLDWIEKQPDLDPSRVGIYGGSYGGYVVLGSLTTYAERFKAGIDVVGITNFVNFLETTPEFRRDLRREEYGDERDPEVRKVLQEISPLEQADKIKAALFVAHGKNDPRVPLSEAEQIVKKMRELRRPVWFAVAQDEGHGFAKKANSDLMAVLYAAFWKEHLLK